MSEKYTIDLSCESCLRKTCSQNTVNECSAEDYPDFCLTNGKNALPAELIEEAVNTYLNDPEDQNMFLASSAVEAENYCKMTRVEEICEFAKKMGYKKLGIATCVGLLCEARAAASIFRTKGFEIYAVSCKAGSIPKARLGFESSNPAISPIMCNPIMQAKALEREKTDLNVVIGLCVGHDSLFYKYSAAPATTLVTKDRVLGHNPAAALYQLSSYYSKLLQP